MSRMQIAESMGQTWQRSLDLSPYHNDIVLQGRDGGRRDRPHLEVKREGAFNMNRQDLRTLALIRLCESKILLDKKKYSGAYYLCGYVIECGLKACICKKVKRSQFPDLDFVKESWNHKLSQLIKTAALYYDWDKKMKSDKGFAANWGVVKDWETSSRYKKINKQNAIDLYNAVADGSSGVLKWIRSHW